MSYWHECLNLWTGPSLLKRQILQADRKNWPASLDHATLDEDSSFGVVWNGTQYNYGTWRTELFQEEP